jgi:YYY domain-containing protein
MAAWLAWYLIISLLGWLTFPLIHRLFPALADRGYALARAAGLLVWAYAFWLFTSLGLTENNVGGILFGLLPLIALSVAAMLLPRRGLADPPSIRGAYGEETGPASEVIRWVRQNLSLVVTIEILFLAAFAFLAFIRAGNPTLDNAEKPMELMFINSILRSPSFPPHDSWLSGYAISYYYFGYVMAAMLARLAGLTGSIAHNLMTALIFGLAAIGAYGILYDLLAARGSVGRDREAPRSVRAGLAFLAPLFLLLVSNLEGFLEVLHRRGLFWSGTLNFWTWLGIRELNEAPTQPLGWIPDRFWWWWRASRVVSDFDLAGNFREVIDEFPFFSFLHADLHPHVLAIPFNLLAIAIALNLFLGGWRGETNLFGLRLRLSPVGFAVAAFTLGGLAFLNTWDILIAAALIVLAYVLVLVRREGWSWSRLVDVFALGLPLGIAAILLFLPFYLGFSSQAGGILPNLDSPTRGAQLWVMFAPLFIPLLSYLLYVWRGERRAGRWKLALALVVGLVLILWVLSWGIALLALLRDPAFAGQYLGSEGGLSLPAFFAAATARRLAYLGGLLSLVAILVPALAFLLADRGAAQGSDPPATKRVARARKRTDTPTPTTATEKPEGGGGVSPASFVFLLITAGSLLVITPEFVFLRDQFGSRMNTIFKLYYQAWLLWSLAAAFGTAVLLVSLRGSMQWIFQSGLVLLLILSLTYPALALDNKTDKFDPALGWTLNDFRRIQLNYPDEAAGIVWLRSAPEGVLVEAVGGSYTDFARVSEYTGLPSVLGWPGHESQWRGSYAPQGSRQDDVKLLYSTPDWDVASGILQKYGIRYVYIGERERATYPVYEAKFQQNLTQVFQRGSVTIYEVP